MKQHQGFSLLELSIVLVIIGLIVGGIVAGASMIRSAELNKIGTDLARLQTTINTFKLKYDARPGDMKNAYSFWGADCGTDTENTSASCNGNGNGNYETQNELVEFAHHLALSQMISGSYTGTYGVGTVADPYYTDEVIETSLNGVFRPWYSASVLYDKSNVNFISVAALDSTGNTTLGILSPSEAWSVDKKIDDGEVDSGKLYIGGCTGGTPTAPSIDLSIEDTTCWLRYWVY